MTGHLSSVVSEVGALTDMIDDSPEHLTEYSYDHRNDTEILIPLPCSCLVAVISLSLLNNLKLESPGGHPTDPGGEDPLILGPGTPNVPPERACSHDWPWPWSKPFPAPRFRLLCTLSRH